MGIETTGGCVRSDQETDLPIPDVLQDFIAHILGEVRSALVGVVTKALKDD